MSEDVSYEAHPSVFVHRVRDIAAPIRMDCQRELGEWFKKYGDVFIGSQVMSYVMKGCNDPVCHMAQREGCSSLQDSKVRLETVKAIPSLVHTEANSSRAQSHLLRLAPRVVDLAIHDIDVNVRVNALHLLGRLEKTGAFDEESGQRAQIATLIYASEPKIRKAASAFFTSLWEARVEELKVAPGKKGYKKKKTLGEEELDQRYRYKALAAILLQNAQDVEPHAALDQTRITARASAAVEALWVEMEELQNWEDLTEYLLRDHNGGGADGLLEEDEEGMLLGVLVAAVKHDERVSPYHIRLADEKDDEDEQNEQTKSLIGMLPRILTKYQADPDRLLTVLALPEIMKLDVYQELRKIKVGHRTSEGRLTVGVRDALGRHHQAVPQLHHPEYSDSRDQGPQASIRLYCACDAESVQAERARGICLHLAARLDQRRRGLQHVD